MPEMEYLIRFSQSHETFRLPEIEALAIVEGIDLKVISYSLEVGVFKFHSLDRDTSMPGQKAVEPISASQPTINSQPIQLGPLN